MLKIKTHIKFWPLLLCCLSILFFSFYLMINSYTAQFNLGEETLFDQIISRLNSLSFILKSL
ncbi:MAG: hypothetical protein HQK49_04365 [Oligoflexia bacterium]|nr:hypothetical protein [Oligoflexia bacterium]